ncbi:putative AAA family ATPase [Rosellinia necatrix]|uniref:Putative AAA family ATPase n=1 Tax=Rosellinia necatrix TaxID=77044 RepID=A0A1S7UQ87_ROSNE|nr:putative AAA family ATPase [Rosellinia necatrix]
MDNSDDVHMSGTRKYLDANIRSSATDRDRTENISMTPLEEAMDSIDQEITLPERRTKYHQRLLQNTANVELVGDQINDLERQAPNLVNHVQYIPRVGELGWAEFSHRARISSNGGTGEWKHRPEIDRIEKPIIEVLIEKPRRCQSISKSTRQNFGDSQRRTGDNTPYSFESREGSPEPYQIRIRSRSILQALQNITGLNVAIGPHKHRLIMLQPFKLLVHFEQDIKRFIREAEDKGSNQITYMNRKPADRERAPVQAVNTADPDEEIQLTSALKELKILCNWIDKSLSRSVKLQQGIMDGITKIKFNELWYIFKPGDEVRTPGDTQIQLYRVVMVTGGRDSDLDRPYTQKNHSGMKLRRQGYSQGAFVIECFYIHFDGTKFGPVNTTFQICKFEGERDIAMLPIIPLRFYSNRADTRKRLMARGKRFADLSGPGISAHRKYKGLTLDTYPEQVESEVMVDFELAFIQTTIERPSFGLWDRLVDDDVREILDAEITDQFCREPGCCGNDITFDDYSVDDIERNRFIAENKALFDDNLEHPSQLRLKHLVLLPPHVYGFVLRTRRWATFDIDRLDEIPRNEEGWNDLVIQGYIKNTIFALVKNHGVPPCPQALINGSLSSLDLYPAKGRGLIILLHGEPGVGKTSTAECVAALTGRPLFPITCGDIGDRAKRVETNLERCLQLAQKWGCVLLLDEADTFLSARTARDAHRNAIVSVFLRTLEYYSGILFLTTNRVCKIDQAFKSRIHFSFLYEKLNRERTIQIWENNIRRVQDEFQREGRKIECDANDIIKFAKRHYKELKHSDDLVVWNGRQIRNAFQTAIAIATYEANQRGNGQDVATPVVDASQFKVLARSARQFDKYLKRSGVFADIEMARGGMEVDGDDSTSTSEEEDKRRRGRTKKHYRKASKNKRKKSRHDGSDGSSGEDSGGGLDESEDSNCSSEDDDEEDARQRKKKRMH